MATLHIIVFVIVFLFGLLFLFVPYLRDLLNTNSKAIGVVFAAVAGAYVLIEYQNQQNEQRLDRTRSYIERIESGTVHESRQWFDLHWVVNRDLVKDIYEANYGASANEEIATQLIERYMVDFDEMNLSENEQRIQHVMRLFYFYSDLAKCVELGLCDSRTACEVFARDIGTFYVLHADFIKKWREVSFERNFDTIVDFLNLKCGEG